MVMGSTMIDNSGCNIFVESNSSKMNLLIQLLLQLQLYVLKGSMQNIKQWCGWFQMIAACTLKVTSQCQCTDIDSSLSRNIGTNDRAILYHHIKLWSYTDTLFIFVLNYLFLTRDMLPYIQCNMSKIIFWPWSSLQNMLAPLMCLSGIHILLKSNARSKISTHKLKWCSRSLRLRPSGQTGLNFILGSSTRRPWGRICEPQVCP